MKLQRLTVVRLAVALSGGLLAWGVVSLGDPPASAASGLMAAAKAAPAALTGNAAHGNTFYQLNCASCHGRAGQAFIVSYPRLSAQIPDYTVQQLTAFRSGKREGGVMNAVAKKLSDQDIADLATALAASGIARPWASSDAALRASGQKLYTSGDASHGLSACAGCHGADGRGNAAAGFPLIAGQSPGYFVTRIADLARGNTDGSANAQLMTKIAKAMTPADVKALDEYIKTLPTAGQ